MGFSLGARLQRGWGVVCRRSREGRGSSSGGWRIAGGLGCGWGEIWPVDGMHTKDSTSAGVVCRLGCGPHGGLLAEGSTPAGLGSRPSPESGGEGLIVWRVARCRLPGLRVGPDLASGWDAHRGLDIDEGGPSPGSRALRGDRLVIRALWGVRGPG